MKKLLILLLPFIMMGCNERIEKEKVYKIGITQIVDHQALNDARQGFIDAIDKSNILVEYDYRNANKDMTAQSLIIQQFIADDKDMIYTIATPSSQVAAGMTKDIPIVFSAVSDPEGAGLTNISNVTGTSGAPTIKENIDLLREIFPKTIVVGTIYNSGEQNSVRQVEELIEYADSIGITIIAKTAENAQDIILASNELVNEIDVFYAMQDNTLASYFNVVLDILNNKKIPILGSNSIFTDMGALISQGTTDYMIGYRAGEMAIRILKGENISDIHIEKVTSLEIVLNEENMKLLDLNIDKEGLKNK